MKIRYLQRLLNIRLAAFLMVCCLWHAGCEAQRKEWPGAKSYIYRYTLRDKQLTRYTLDNPQQYLSQRAIERRRRQQLAVDSTDLPVCEQYIALFRGKNVSTIGTSRWNNTVLVEVKDTATAQQLAQLSCVASCRRVWTSPDSIEQKKVHTKVQTRFNRWDTVATNRYAAASEQIRLAGGMALHTEGYTGRGLHIAVLDGGFQNVHIIPAFRSCHILGSRDFVFPNSSSIFHETDHGTKVLSAMAVNAPYVYIGTAPDASYWLLRCEDQHTEQLIAEDYWAMSAEFADSAGVDIINSSLGYNTFDHHADNHRYCEMDGRTALISRSASMLAQKGIVLVTSAGNSGLGPWKKITFPGDANDLLTVGAITIDRHNAPFCGVGPTQDGRIKPDVMALGSPAGLISGRGTIVQDMGTSFSCPVVCGLVACLWQAHPEKTALDIIEMVRQSSDRHQNPDNVYGYGIPDFSTLLPHPSQL